MTRMIRYYQVSSNSLEEIAALDKEILKQDFHHSANKEIIPYFERKDRNPIEIVYTALTTVRNPQKKLFKKNISGRYKVEILLEIDEEQAGILDKYIASTNFDLGEIKKVNLATVTFATYPCHSQTSENYGAMLSNFVKNNYPEVKCEIKLTQNVSWEGVSGDCCSGVIYGPVRDVIALHTFLNQYKIGTSVKQLGLSFLSGKKGEHSVEELSILMPSG